MYPPHLASPMYSPPNAWYPPSAAGYLQSAFVPTAPPPNPYFMMNPVNVNYGGWVSPYKMGFNYGDMINLPPNMGTMGSMGSMGSMGGGGFLGNQTPIIINNNMTSPNQKVEELKKRENHLFREERAKLEERLNFQKEEKSKQQLREDFIKGKSILANTEKSEYQSIQRVAGSSNKERQDNSENKRKGDISGKFDGIQIEKGSKETEENFLSLNVKTLLESSSQKYSSSKAQSNLKLNDDQTSINNNAIKKPDEQFEKKPMIYFQDEPSSKTLAASFLEKKKKLAERKKPNFPNTTNSEDKSELKNNFVDEKILKEQFEKKPMTFFEDETSSKNLAELFLEKKKKLAEKMQKNSEKTKEKELSVEPVNKRSKEEILKTRKEIMMEYKKTTKKSIIPKETSLARFNSQSKEEDNKQNNNANDELLRRLALGIKPKVKIFLF